MHMRPDERVGWPKTSHVATPCDTRDQHDTRPCAPPCTRTDRAPRATCVGPGGVYDARRGPTNHDEAAMPEHVTVHPGAADRLSLAFRLRGWKDEAQGLEQRLKDLETFARKLRRRWWKGGGGVLMGLLGWAYGVVKTRPATMVLVAGGGGRPQSPPGPVNEGGGWPGGGLYPPAALGLRPPARVRGGV